MKIGMRTPNLKKSFKARTTGKLKRTIKKSVLPGYGKKGIGLIKSPKKSIYNKVYNKTTFGINDLFKTSKSSFSFGTILLYAVFFPIVLIYWLIKLYYYIFKYIFIGVKKLIECLKNRNNMNKDKL